MEDVKHLSEDQLRANLITLDYRGKEFKTLALNELIRRSQLAYATWLTAQNQNLSTFASTLLSELNVRIEDRANSSLPEWERQAERLGITTN